VVLVNGNTADGKSMTKDEEKATKKKRKTGGESRLGIQRRKKRKKKGSKPKEKQRLPEATVVLDVETDTTPKKSRNYPVLPFPHKTLSSVQDTVWIFRPRPNM
jgi:hypothetical protein